MDYKEHYDGHSFSWNDGEFSYSECFDDNIEEVNVDVYKLIASSFLSGFTGKTLSVSFEQGAIRPVFVEFKDNNMSFMEVVEGVWSELQKSFNGNLVIFGDFETHIEEFFRFNFRDCQTFICNMKDEALTSFGMLVSKLMIKGLERPRKIDFRKYSTSDIDGYNKMSFQSDMDDFLGQGANCITKRQMPYLNQIYEHDENPCYDVFSNRVMATEVLSCNYVNIVSMDDVDKYFPNECNAKKRFGATFYPLNLETIEQFKELFGGLNPKVFVASDNYSDLRTLVNMCKVFGNEKPIRSHFVGNTFRKAQMPTFKRHAVYATDDKYFKKIIARNKI